MVDDRAAFDTAAWPRLVSLVPGAVAVPARIADAYGVQRVDVHPPGTPPARLVDLWRRRRALARQRRAETTFEADLALHHAAVLRAVESALSPGDGGAALVTLPTYALAARLDVLLGAPADWELPAAIDLAAADATMRLVQLLTERGERDPWRRLGELQSGGGSAGSPPLEHLADIDDAPEDEQGALLGSWLEGPWGWHAPRDLLVEAQPLRDDPDAARRAAAAMRAAADLREVDTPDGDAGAADRAPNGVDIAEDDRELRDAVERTRRLTSLRERVARERALHVAGIRALCWTIARSLHMAGTLPSVDAAFDLDVADLLGIARGATVEEWEVEPDIRIDLSQADRSPLDDLASSAPRELRGTPASRGTATGRVVVLDEPTLDADVDGAVLVCRVTDPAWLPLMLRCAALVTERGGPLSHAAIVARELGLPAVVGVAGVRAAAATAARATVDGAAGTITLEL